jgi:hypothetical protein
MLKLELQTKNQHVLMKWTSKSYSCEIKMDCLFFYVPAPAGRVLWRRAGTIAISLLLNRQILWEQKLDVDVF